MSSPKLVSIDCSRYAFQPGDKILIRAFGALDPTQKTQIRKTVEKWAGCELDILIIDTTQMEIEVSRPSPIIQP